MQICEKMKENSYNVQYHNEIHAVSAYKELEWIGFDNIVSIEEKTKYAKLMALGGVMVYWIDGDDRSNICGSSRFPLLEAVRSIYPIPDDPPTTVKPPSTTVTPGNHISKAEAKVLCISQEHGSSFANPLQSCTNRYFRCLRIMLDDFIPHEGICHDPLVFDESTHKCDYRQNVDACKD